MPETTEMELMQAREYIIQAERMLDRLWYANHTEPYADTLRTNAAALSKSAFNLWLLLEQLMRKSCSSSAGPP